MSGLGPEPQAAGAKAMAELKAAGFTDEDIGAWRQRRAGVLSEAGFSQGEIDTYFGQPPFDDAPIRTWFRDVLGGLKEDAATFTDALDVGFGTSVTGLAVRGRAPEKGLSENAPIAERLGVQVGMLAGDLPLMLAGAVPGVMHANPIVAGGAAFALPEALRAVLMDAYTKGEIDSPGRFWEALSGALIAEFKGFVTGAATFGAGAGARALGAGPVLGTAAEIGTMVTVGHALEGEIPAPEAFLDAAIVVGGLKASVATVAKLQNIYVRTGVRPAELVEAAKQDPTIAQDILSENRDIPRAFEDRMELVREPGPDRVPEAPAEAARTTPRATPFEAAGREPKRLVQFLREMGGVRDDGGDVRHTLGGARQRPGLVNNRSGVPLDEAALRASEAGYLTGNRERADINALLAAIEDDLKGQPRYSLADDARVLEYRAALERNAEIDRLASEHGIPTENRTRAQFFDELTEKLTVERAAAESRSLAEAIEADYAKAAAEAKAFLESRGDAWEPDVAYTRGRPRTLEDLEREWREATAADPVGRSEGGGPGSRPAAGNPGAVQVDSGQGGNGAAPAGSRGAQAGPAGAGGEPPGGTTPPGGVTPPAGQPAPARPAPQRTPQDIVLERVSVGERDGRRYGLTELYRDTVDKLHPLNKAVQAMAEGRPLSVVADAYRQARMLPAATTKAEHFLEYGTFDFNTYRVTGRSLRDVLAPVKDDLDGLRAYAVAKRAIELEGRGMETGVDPAAARAVVMQGAQKFAPVFRELQAFQDATVKYLKDAGLISDQMHAVMRAANQDYVPFFRVMEETGGKLAPETAGGPKGAGAGMETRQPIRAIKGSERRIVDPLESVIKNTYLYINLAERNAVGRALVELAERSPRGAEFAQKAKTPVREIRATDQEIADFLSTYERQLGVTLTPTDLSLWRPNALSPKENQIAVWRAGKRELWTLDPEVAATFKALDVEGANVLAKIMAFPARLLRAGAVLSPEFIARNPVRDQLSAFIFSDKGLVPFLDLARGIFSMAKKDADYQAWLRSGGPMATLVSLDRTYLQKGVRDIAGATGLLDATWNVIKSPVEALRILSDAAEQGTRIGEFKRVSAGARTKEAIQEGGFASREVTLDFQRIGAKTQAMNMLVAFFNATVQGGDKMARSFRDHPFRTSAKVAASITIPSVLLHLANRGDPDYEDLPAWQRDLFWIVLDDRWRPMQPGEAAPQHRVRTVDGVREINDRVIWRIPKPFELGVIFGTAFERMADYLLDQDPQAFDGLLDAIARGAMPSVVPTAVVPVMEQWANRSLFADRPIIPADREGLLPEYQYAPYTTELTKALGQLVGSLPPLKQSAAASPIVIDNYVRGWTGGLGVHIVNLADAALRKAGVLPDPVKPAETLADLPVIKAFIVRHPTATSENIQRFYDRFGEKERVLKTVRKLAAEGNAEAALREVKLAGPMADLGPFRDALSQSMKAVRLIEKNPDIGAVEKRQLIDAIYFQMMEIARAGNQALDAVERTAQPARPAPAPARSPSPGPATGAAPSFTPPPGQAPSAGAGNAPFLGGSP